MFRYVVAAITVLAFAGSANRADASAVFTGSSGGLSASATFTISGSTLTILLTNTDASTGAGAPVNSASVLSGLFFNLGTATFTPDSALTVGDGSIIQTSNCDVLNCDGQTNVGGEWSYASGGASWLTGTTQGISSSGYLTSNTSSGNFKGPNYQNPNALNGIEFGLVPNNWVAGSGNGGLDSNALIEGTVQFVLNLPAGSTLTEADIKNVYFTYGTSPGENTVPGGTTSATPTTTTTPTTGNVPEPALLSMLGIALAGAAYRMRKPGSKA